jgi:hypothetical protein
MEKADIISCVVTFQGMRMHMTRSRGYVGRLTVARFTVVAGEIELKSLEIRIKKIHNWLYRYLGSIIFVGGN